MRLARSNTPFILPGVVWPCVVAAMLALALPARVRAPETLLPDQSAAKAKHLLQQTITALGGQAYLGVRDTECEGRLSFFSHAGELTGYQRFLDLWKLPDKNRTEYSKKRNIIDVYNGSQGWTLDRGGVREVPASQIEEFQEQIKKDADNLLRFRLNEDGMIFRYGGSDILDLRQVDWVEIVDRDRRTFRLALDRSTHLPIRSVIITRNPVTRERTEEVTYFSNWHSAQGIQTPFQMTRERNGLKVYQVFFSECRYNVGLPEQLFTRTSLEQRYSEVAKKKK